APHTTICYGEYVPIDHADCTNVTFDLYENRIHAWWAFLDYGCSVYVTGYLLLRRAGFIRISRLVTRWHYEPRFLPPQHLGLFSRALKCP
ncbi:MAG: hypothetical protein WA184_03960, partial [Stellaceae bacterium]